MKTKTTKPKKTVNNPCVVCGKEVRWGVNGCPMVRKGQEMMALMGGGWEYMKHYKCEMPTKTVNKQ
jgi:hypothetical protein